MTPDDFERLSEEVERAGDALTRLADGPAREAADTMRDAFERAGQSIESALTRAARTGELSFSAMADAILRDLSRVATERFVTGPIDQLMSGLTAQLPFFGARAEGGPVQPGGSYLVGERGPEVFTPGAAGQISAAAPIQVTVNLNGPVSGETVRRSETQIATALARAVRKGAARL
ncbi:phage tail tape measure C-terminal domain-containing protein [Hyphobacterium sp.]|jgi:phage-related minor tail protein|uniref:phage tail tape measure C-terminal domain-containing protein n=1 Tax=Hyphobacterium sp. TaxID=2004662 RepID=UPI003BAC25D6